MVVVEIVHEILADALAQHLFDIGDVHGKILLAERGFEESAETRHDIILEAIRFRNRNHIVRIWFERWIRNACMVVVKGFTL